MKTFFFIFLFFTSKFGGKIHTKGGYHRIWSKYSPDCWSIPKTFGFGCISVPPKVFLPPNPWNPLLWLRVCYCTVLLAVHEMYCGLRPRVVNGPTSPGPNPARTRKLIWRSNHAQKNPKVKLGLKNLAMSPIYFEYIFVHPRQKVRLRPELSSKFFSTFGPNPARTRTRPEKPGPTYNSAATR